MGVSHGLPADATPVLGRGAAQDPLHTENGDCLQQPRPRLRVGTFRPSAHHTPRHPPGRESTPASRDRASTHQARSGPVGSYGLWTRSGPPPSFGVVLGPRVDKGSIGSFSARRVARNPRTTRDGPHRPPGTDRPARPRPKGGAAQSKRPCERRRCPGSEALTGRTGPHRHQGVRPEVASEHPGPRRSDHCGTSPSPIVEIGSSRPPSPSPLEIPRPDGARATCWRPSRSSSSSLHSSCHS